MKRFEVIDLFCGAGGVTAGIRQARYQGKTVADVIVCINHDDTAIQSHKANHRKSIHFTEDIRTFDLSKLPKLDHTKLTVLWASLECTNFSKAKGGKPRDADSRTLAEHLYRYIKYINPDYVMIENVREFMSWGKIDQNGKPVSMDKGRDYLKWVKEVMSFGYSYDYRLLDAADFGAYCLRKRFFGMFAKKGLPLKFPLPTHSKKSNPMFKTKPWKPVRECLDLEDEGNSIFERKKELSENTLKRILEGLKKFATHDKFMFTSISSSLSKNGIKYNPGKSVETVSNAIPTHNRLGIVFLSKYYSGKPKQKNISVDGPAGTITTIDNQAIVNCEFLTDFYGNGKALSKDIPINCISTKDKFAVIKPVHFIQNYNGKGKAHSTEKPSSCIDTNDRFALVTPVHFLDCQYSNGRKNQSENEPSGSILTNPKERMVTCQFVDMQYSDGKNTRDIDSPLGAITKNPKANLVSPKFIIDRQYNNKSNSLEKPAKTIIAHQGKRPMYLISPVLAQHDEGYAIMIYKNDTDTMKLIKEFMAANGIIDIKMRMLKVPELKKIMGLHDNYVLLGNQTKQKWMIGNMVHPLMSRKWFEALAGELDERKNLSKAA